MKSFGSKASGARLERMQASPRWAGEGFRNRHPILPGLRDPTAPMPTWGDFLCAQERGIPARPLPALNPLDAWRRRPDSGLRVTWLGHSTVLIEIDGVRVLTDPVWGPRASPLAARRAQALPAGAGRAAGMPPLDLVLVSHDHYDHLDYPTIRALAKREVPFVTSLGVGAHLEAWGVRPRRITELDWWESYELPRGGVRVTAAPSQHFSGRGAEDAQRDAVVVVRRARRQRHALFFSGDTGLTTEYGEIRAAARAVRPGDARGRRVSPGVGRYPSRARERARRRSRSSAAAAFLPVHWGTFKLALHAWDQPAERLLELSPRSQARFIVPRLGEPVEPALASGQIEPWWRSVDRAEQPVLAAPAEGALPDVAPWPLD